LAKKVGSYGKLGEKAMPPSEGSFSFRVGSQ